MDSYSEWPIIIFYIRIIISLITFCKRHFFHTTVFEFVYKPQKYSVEYIIQVSVIRINESKYNRILRLIRDDIVVYNGSVSSLQHEKDQLKEVKKDMDCGMTLEGCQDYQEGDIIEVFELVEIKR